MGTLSSHRAKIEIVPQGKTLVVLGNRAVFDCADQFFQPEFIPKVASDIRADYMLCLDFDPEKINMSVAMRAQTVRNYIAQDLEGKLEDSQVKVEDWAEAFDLGSCLDGIISDLSIQHLYRLLFFDAVARPTHLLCLTNTKNFKDFPLLVLDMNSFFRNHNLNRFRPGLVIVEEKRYRGLGLICPP